MCLQLPWLNNSPASSVLWLSCQLNFLLVNVFCNFFLGPLHDQVQDLQSSQLDWARKCKCEKYNEKANNSCAISQLFFYKLTLGKWEKGGGGPSGGRVAEIRSKLLDRELLSLCILLGHATTHTHIHTRRHTRTHTHTHTHMMHIQPRHTPPPSPLPPPPQSWALSVFLN